MAVPASLPQDIVETVIEQISPYDVETLKRCSIVSRSFLAPSQKQLFSVVYLTKGRVDCRRLYHLLLSTPHIATYIRELHVIVFSDPPHHRGTKKWVYGEETFPRLLQTMRPGLKSFSLVMKYDSVNWALFPSVLQTAILDLCTSPNLMSIRLISICADQFPIATLGASKHLKRLGFLSCSHLDCWRVFTPIPLPSPSANEVDKAQLESIELGGYTSRSIIGSLLLPQSLLGVSRLREISIKSETWWVLEGILSANRHIAQSIESLMWLDARHLSPGVSNQSMVGIFPRLRFLGFCISITEEASEGLTQIVHLLTNGYIPSTLEELTIIVESDGNVWQDGLEPANVKDICLFLELSGFDGALVTGTQEYHKLCRVNIFVDISDRYKYRDDEVLQSLLLQKLPLLAARGILSGRLCDKNEILARSSILPVRSNTYKSIS